MITRLFGLLLFSSCLAVVYLFEGGDGTFRLFHWPAMVLTGIGPMALILVSFDSTVLGRTIRFLTSLNSADRQEIHEREAILLHRLSRAFYTEGAEVFDRVKARGLSNAVRKMIERLTVGIPLADISELLEVDRAKTESRMIQSLNLISLGVRLSPSLGMLGTILGMVRLLSTLQDPSQIGSHMSLALLTTFYGLFFSLLLWTPLQQKMERLLEVELEGFDQALKWLEFLERRKPINYFADTAELPSQFAPPQKASG